MSLQIGGLKKKLRKENKMGDEETKDQVEGEEVEGEEAGENSDCSTCGGCN
jgi:hypothetical protein